MSDEERAADIRKRFNLAAIPIVSLLRECVANGFNMEFSIRIHPNGEPDLKCDITKVTKF